MGDVWTESERTIPINAGTDKEKSPKITHRDPQQSPNQKRNSPSIESLNADAS
jgi:hypothetical protein